MQERRKNKYIILDPMNHRGGGAFFTLIMENYMAHLLETSILNLSTLIKHESSNGLNDSTNTETCRQSLNELAETARSLASWSSQYSPSNNNWESTDAPHQTMAKILKESVRVIPKEQ